MDNRPVGVFDSGLGGLTSAEKLRRLAPGEELIYFGDTGRMPYGGRSYGEILTIARQNIEFLLSFNVKAIIAACGTISSNVLHIVKDEYEAPVLGVLDPAVKVALGATKNGHIGVIATQATTNSEAYPRRLLEADSGLKITAMSCPKFVPLIETGRFDNKDWQVKSAVEEYLAPIKEGGADTLILGCTHYPLLSGPIRDYLGEKVCLVDSGAAAANELADYLKLKDIYADVSRRGEETYYTSGNASSFAALAEVFLGRSIKENTIGILPMPL